MSFKDDILRNIVVTRVKNHYTERDRYFSESQQFTGKFCEFFTLVKAYHLKKLFHGDATMFEMDLCR